MHQLCGQLGEVVLGELQSTRSFGISLFPTEIFRTSKRWAQQRFTNLIYFNADIQSGGHFAALEAPQTLTEELWHWKQRLRDSAIL